MMLTAFLVAAVSTLMAKPASAGEFLRSKGSGELQQAVRASIEEALQAELAMDTARLRRFEKELEVMYLTLPKNEHGKLESPAVRYALHRYFVHKHGWYVTGLEPLGQPWNSTSPTAAVKGRVPAYIHSLLDQRLDGHGIGLHELAAFAATLLDFVHNEALADIMDLYAALRLEPTMPVEAADADRVVQGYFLQLLDGNTTIKSPQDIGFMDADMTEWFPLYGDFKMWTQDVRQTMALERQRTRFEGNALTLHTVIRDVEVLNDRIFAFQDIECRTLKAGLADMEYNDTGRLLLSDFYKAGLRGDFLFVEHIDFLRKAGALDESNPNHPSVIIANFLTSKANCLTESNFHSVCCMDECQGLMATLEHSITAPMAAPGRISELVSRMPSDSVDAPRNLSASLLSRLRDVADHHDGQVPLHGRLFAQWMHHAYPLECPYPHAAGTTNPLTQDEWMDFAGTDDATAPEQERLRYANQERPGREIEMEVPWMQLEELVVPHKLHRHQGGWIRVRKASALAAVLALALSIAKASAVLIKPCHQTQSDKVLV